MKALVKTRFGEDSLCYMDIPEPQIRPDELKIRVHACGICASDLHIMHDTYPSFPPVAMGHEYSGVVEEVGAEVTGFAPGDRVVSLTSIHTCGNCEFCFAGHRMLCPERRSIGSGRNGGFAPYIAIPAKLAFHIPANVSMNTAALCEPLACSVRGVLERTVIKGGDLVLVSGAGVIGQLSAQVAKACGGVVFMAGTAVDRERLALAKTLGIRDTINIDEESLDDAVKRLTGGRGFDVALECAGAGPSMDNCLRAVKKTGNLTQIGLFGKPIPFNFDLALMKELNISNSYASERTSWERALRLLEYGLIEVEPLIGSSIKLEAWAEAFKRVIDRVDFKVLLVP